MEENNMEANEKATKLGQLEMLAQRTKAEADKLGEKIKGFKVPVYDLKKQAAAETGFLATYYLEKDGAQVGEKINIPKDFLVKSASVKTADTADTPYAGAKVGDKYIDFVVNAKEGESEESHMYLAVGDLVSAYTGGNGVTVGADNTISVKVSETDANGLTAGADGLKLALATQTAPGALSAADKVKLDSLEFATDAEVTTMLDGVFGAEETAG